MDKNNFLNDLKKRKILSPVITRATNYVCSLHTKMRRDGATPEFHHLLDVAHRISVLPLFSGDTQEFLILVALLHDTPEDYNISINEIVRVLSGDNVNDSNFGYYKDIAESAWLLSKVDKNGKRIPTSQYFRLIAEKPELLLVKAADGLSNLIDSVTAQYPACTQLSIFVLNYCRYIQSNHLKHLKRLKDSDCLEIRNAALLLKTEIEDMIKVLRNTF